MTPEERALIGYLPVGQPRAVPTRIVAVLIELDTGAVARFPVSPPARLDRPPARIEIIAGKAYVRSD